MTTRRSFLSAMFAAAAAPAVVSASSIMRVAPVMDSGVLTYRASGRYDLNPESLEEMMISIRNDIAIRPSRIIVPSSMIAECEIILNKCFDKEYAQWIQPRQLS